MEPPHVVLLTDPGTGHLIPMVALAKHLHNKLKFSVTLIAQPTSLSSNSQQSILNTLPKQINIISLPQLQAHLIPKGCKPHEASILAIVHNLPIVKKTLQSLNSSDNPIVAIVVDMFSAVAIDTAIELNIATYLFFTSSIFSLYLGSHFRNKDAMCVPEVTKLPGCVPIQKRDLPEPLLDYESAKRFLELLKLHNKPKAILVNSFKELEPAALENMQADVNVAPTIYPVGPLVSDLSDELSDETVQKWMDMQANDSVIYVSFGSGGTLSHEQIKELAFGLEMSEQRFIWVVKKPNENEASADYMGVDNVGIDAVEFLPSGFVERTEGVGLVLLNWAPQIQILKHKATGAFLTHCGWNSILESVVNGVPMIAWPLFAEQGTNAVMITEDLKVAVRVEKYENGVVKREEISRLLRHVMVGEEGKKLKNRMKEIQDAAISASEEGGSSYKSLSEIACKWNLLEN